MTSPEKAATQAEAFAAVVSERMYQDAKGVATDGSPHKHSIEEFLVYMDDYLTDAKHVASRTWGGTAKKLTLDVIRKVTALGVACMEYNGAPQREGFETEFKHTPPVALDVTQDTLYGRLQNTLRLLQTLPPDAGGLDHNSARGDSGGGYHQPRIPPVIDALQATIEGMTHTKSASIHGTHVDTPWDQVKRLGQAILDLGILEPSKDEGAVDCAIRLLKQAYQANNGSAKVPL